MEAAQPHLVEAHDRLPDAVIGILALAAAAQCPHVELVLAEQKMVAAFRGRPAREATASFNRAYAKACSEGLLKKPLAIGNKLFLINAPEANVASIYKDKGRTVLEYPFVTGDGHAHAPPPDDLHEAIYCAVHGASAKEQEESGRCLPD